MRRPRSTTSVTSGASSPIRVLAVDRRTGSQTQNRFGRGLQRPATYRPHRQPPTPTLKSHSRGPAGVRCAPPTANNRVEVRVATPIFHIRRQLASVCCSCGWSSARWSSSVRLRTCGRTPHQPWPSSGGGIGLLRGFCQIRARPELRLEHIWCPMRGPYRLCAIDGNAADLAPAPSPDVHGCAT